MKESSLGREYAEAWHPGSALAGLMELNDSDLDEVEQMTGASRSDLESLVNLEADMTDELAAALGDIFGHNEAFWRNLQITYDREMSRELAREAVAGEVPLLERFRAKEAAKLGWLPRFRDKRDGVLLVRKFLNQESLDGFALASAGRFRITGRSDSHAEEALAMWLRQGEIEASTITVPEFGANAFKRALGDIRRLTSLPPQEFLPRIFELCEDAGVIFVVIETIPTAGANGVTRWRADGRPWIQVNFKGNDLDRFWFTFFHEAAHVLQGEPDVAVIHMGDATDDHDDMERRADAFAADTLIPPSAWDALTTHGKPAVSKIRSCARSLGIHPGIVVGRLQKAGLAGWNDTTFDALKSKVTLDERKSLAALDLRNREPASIGGSAV